MSLQPPKATRRKRESATSRESAHAEDLILGFAQDVRINHIIYDIILALLFLDGGDLASTGSSESWSHVGLSAP